MDNRRLREEGFGLLRPWKEALKAYLDAKDEGSRRALIGREVSDYGNLLHFKAIEGFAALRDVARRYDDDRGRRYADIFGKATGDISITDAYPGVIHRLARPPASV